MKENVKKATLIWSPTSASIPSSYQCERSTLKKTDLIDSLQKFFETILRKDSNGPFCTLIIEYQNQMKQL